MPVSSTTTSAEDQPSPEGVRYVVVSSRTGQPIAGAHLHIKEYEDLPECGELAMERYRDIPYDQKSEKVAYIEEALGKWGSKWPRMKNTFENNRRELTNPQFRLSFDQKVVLPEQSQEVSLTEIRNLRSVSLTVYQVNAQGDIDISPDYSEGYKKIKPLLGEVVYETTREYGERSQEIGVRSQETGVRSQETGVRSQETGVRSQETGVRREVEFFEDVIKIKGLPVGVYMLEFQSNPKTELKTSQVRRACVMWWSVPGQASPSQVPICTSRNTPPMPLLMSLTW